ncbi:MAG: hypothetical protein SGJ15_02740 [Bacteroidota bacterium]|nr:hypothetical protein [Bacteroidota bacterium]
MQKSLISIAILIWFSNSFSQTRYESIQRGDNFYTIQNAFNDHWKDKDNSVKGHGYKQYKRWEYFMEARVYPSGNIYLPSTTWDNYQAYLKENGVSYGKAINSSNQINSTTWQLSDVNRKVIIPNLL